MTSWRRRTEAYRVERPGGRTAFFEHNRPDEKRKACWQEFTEGFNPEHPYYRDLMERGLTDEVSGAGFKASKREAPMHGFTPLLLAER